MTELFLKFTDENGDEQRISVEQEEFVIGRHSDNDVFVTNSKLSGQHLKIQRYADIFVVSDLNSTNGTKINGEYLDEPIALQDGDSLNLGGGLEIEIELTSNNKNDSADENTNEESSEKSVAATASTSGGSGFGKALIIAPILGLFFVIVALGGIFLLGKKGNPEIAKNNEKDTEFIEKSLDKNDSDKNDASSSDSNEKQNESSTDETSNEQNSSNPTSSETSTPETTNNSGNDSTTPTNNESDEIGKIREHSFVFMRRISRSSQKPVLLSNQLSILESKINSFKSSNALANNIKNAKSNADAIKQLASSKNLNPQFLATAAMAKLGNQSGNVLAKAQEMADVLDRLNIEIGDEKADDSLILIAAYNQGTSGEFTRMKKDMQKLADRNPERANEVRTIWFLKDKKVDGKIVIDDAQFNLALQFLAIGTITQNPKAFNVNAEALVLN